MNQSRAVLILIVVAAATFGTAAVWVDSPGYLDAEYYRSVALRLATGHGLTVPFLWNYLSGVDSLPAPAHTYWMPLTSLLGALTTVIAPENFRSTQLMFVLLATFLPIVTCSVGRRLGMTVRDALTAGLLACFPGFFLPFWLTSDSFVVFALAGAGVFVFGEQAARRGSGKLAAVAGLAAGLGHLTRADGFLLWIPLLILLGGGKGSRLRCAGLAGLGYALVLLPWLVRSNLMFGSPLPPGLSRALWLTSYDQLFAYPGEGLDWRGLAGSGFRQIAQVRIEAAWTNLKSLILVNGLVFLAVPMAVGVWEMRTHSIVRAAAAYLGVLFLVMSVVFPFAGSRGGFFHSSSALMPVLYPLAVVGIHSLGNSYALRRKLDPELSAKVFLTGVVAIAIVATGFLFNVRVIRQEWGHQFRRYQTLDQRWRGLSENDRVAVNNPAAFWLATGVQAVVIPDGPPALLVAVMADYEVDWAVLESDHPRELNGLYDTPGDRAGLIYQETIEVGVRERLHIYRPTDTEGQE